MAAPDPEILFVYGTLRDAALLCAVLGNDGRHLQLRACVAPSHAIVTYPGEVYPALVPRQGACAHGELVRGLTASEWMRLDFYEGMQYCLGPVLVECEGRVTPALAYLPSCTIGTDAPDWSFTEWARRYQDDAIREALGAG